MTNIPTQKEYYEAEVMRFYNQLQEVERAPLSERRENLATFQDDLANTPEIVVERIGWLLNGSYGYGPYIKAEEVLQSRMNKNAWLFINTAALEWGVSNAHAIKAYKALTKDQQDKLNAMIATEIKDHQEQE